MKDPTKRFSDRVEDYLKYRPRYPSEILETVRTERDLTPAHVVADIGSGTGFLAELFLSNGNTVYGVEPNQQMREAGENHLTGFPHFVSVEGTAEATTLSPACVDFVTAGQAFHWFDHQAARAEFARILKRTGWIVLVWNERRSSGSPFEEDYEQLLRDHAPEYWQVGHRCLSDRDLDSFFGPSGFVVRTCRNSQTFDFEGLRGRLLSSSYTPQSGQPGHEPMLAELREVFERHQQSGAVRFSYDTKVYIGRLES